MEILSAINSIRALGIADQIPAPLIKQLKTHGKGYVKRFAGRLRP